MLNLFRRRPSDPWVIVALLLSFVFVGLWHFWNERGDDLGSSYLGCRIMATGQTSALYSHDLYNFADIRHDDTVWHQLAKQGNYQSYFHPYVQTPLWAWSLQPMCNHMQWPAFKHAFLFLALGALAGCVYLVARYWTPTLFHPLAIAGLLLCLWFSQPFGYAMMLVQTHALYLFLTIAGLILAERDRPWMAGALVACAAAVKLTPAILFLYWLLLRRYKAAFSLAICSVVLLLFTRMVVTPDVFSAYLTALHRVSETLLVAENNQSLAAWWMGRFYAVDEVYDVFAYPLPTVVSLTSTTLMIVSTAGAALIDRTRSFATSQIARPPFGTGVALIAMTVFAPIAWTHYYVILIAAVMLLLQAAIGLKGTPFFWLPTLIILALAALNSWPLAADVNYMDVSSTAILRGQFYSAVLCLSALPMAAWLNSKDVVKKAEHGFDRGIRKKV